MNLGLKDKIIIVTGGAKGIGAGITKSLAAEGAMPVVVGRSAEDNDAIIKKIGTGFGITAELTHPEQCENAVKATVESIDAGSSNARSVSFFADAITSGSRPA